MEANAPSELMFSYGASYWEVTGVSPVLPTWEANDIVETRHVSLLNFFAAPRVFFIIFFVGVGANDAADDALALAEWPVTLDGVRRGLRQSQVRTGSGGGPWTSTTRAAASVGDRLILRDAAADTTVRMLLFATVRDDDAVDGAGAGDACTATSRDGRRGRGTHGD